jgi:hypothetical protein
MEVDKPTLMQILCEFHTIKFDKVNFTQEEFVQLHNAIFTEQTKHGTNQSKQPLSRGEAAHPAKRAPHHARRPLCALCPD